MACSDPERTLDTGSESGERPLGWAVGLRTASTLRGELDAAQITAAVEINRALDDGGACLPLVRAFFGLPVMRASDPALAVAIALFQRDAGLVVNGQIDAATRSAMAAAGFASRAWYAELDERDRLALQAVRDAARQPLMDDGDAVRSVVAAVALMQVGAVLALDRGDGKKFGAERLVAYHRDVGAPASDGVLRAAHRLRLTAPWSGVFATWCVRTASGRGAWRGTPGTGHPLFPWVDRAVDPGLEGIRTGDIAVLGTERGARRMAVVIARTGARLACVVGDVDAQEVQREEIACAEVDGYYATVPSRERRASS